MKAIVAGVAAGVASLFVSIPASVILAERLSSPAKQVQAAGDEFSFQASFVDVNLVPAIVLALLIVVVVFTWLERRRPVNR
jgi:ethanolamine transporter EutH